ncbi:MAG TPA: prepilin peptidase [Candidatus Paceibacterota bacterium]|nr:prepilin peptidase [Candidatus Paceibacterota bacterium]
MFAIFYALVYGLFGLVIGSFLNVVIIRRGARTLGGRSGCLSCGARLAWYDLIPVLSWLALRGRCRTCNASISLQYPLVEASTAMLFALIGLSPLPIAMQAVSLAIIAFLVLITVYDLRHTIIPDEWSYSFALLAFAAGLPFALQQGLESGLVPLLIAGPLCALPLFALWLVSRGRWMGLGDAKLSLGIGFLLGIGPGLLAIFFAFLIGAFVSVFVLLPYSYLRYLLLQMQGSKRITRFRLTTKGFTMRSEVPFGPFLVLGTLVVWLCSIYRLPLPLLDII